MNLTLGIVLPVCNAEATLRGQVQDLLDLLPDLVARFELMIVDDGSTDHTGDIARELSVEYPQVRVLRSRPGRGCQAAVHDAMAQMESELFLVQTAGETLRPSDLRQALKQYQSLPSEPLSLSSDLLTRLTAWGQALERAARSQVVSAPPAPAGNCPTPVLRRAARQPGHRAAK